ncbi:dTDP-4-amino-4,6-dideoxygalactose transaminase [Desulfobaculum xiamenense]|uniref:dTDP-4-amino-4,6-dideoxygalactose transaminase n=1 Tax=Desulfobaculum xiamenense TaxID=995050 RepID=A0A846QEW7_9BACT|nr:DegT/DnrJ/EryC1/StrS family aminotransferase [Desulfobaculum xiamenense]NJB67306.1 dTDP-4-amino-4,6-dideoxygalactose transaminase [Desulfobaculum xiamenense]
MGIPFNSLKAQLAPFDDELRAAFERVLERGWFLMGPEVRDFETEFAAWLARPHAATVGNGTDALVLALKAIGVEPGDEIVLPAHTALPCYHAVLAAGCVPVFAEVEEAYYTLSPDSAARMIGPRTRAVMAVHLYGQCCDIPALDALCRERGVTLIEDCAQAHGATFGDIIAGRTGAVAAFSFYPTKNLGALGDGGAVACSDAEIDRRVRLFKQYGEAHRYESVVAGVNSRMDEMQAAFLRVRLARLDEETRMRRELAAVYDEELAGLPVIRPAVREGCGHVYHLYVIRAPRRAELMAHLSERGIGTAIHYPIPGHRQKLFAEGGAPFRADELTLSERMADEILSLPMYPGLGADGVREVCAAIRDFYA